MPLRELARRLSTVFGVVFGMVFSIWHRKLVLSAEVWTGSRRKPAILVDENPSIGTVQGSGRYELGTRRDHIDCGNAQTWQFLPVFLL